MQADEAYFIGPAPSTESYVRSQNTLYNGVRITNMLLFALQLRMDKIVEVAHKSGAQVWPIPRQS